MDIPVRLLDAVLADPADDTPRLAVAEWLESIGNENDRELAEFIRLQLAVQEGDAPTPRERELQKKLNPRFMNHLGIGRKPIYRGGFIEGLTLTIDEFLAQIPTLVRRIPLRRVRLFRAYGSTARLADVFESPHLSQLCELVIKSRDLDLETLRLLTECRFLSNLDSLTLQYSDLRSPAAELLAGSPVLKRLKKLHLPWNGIGDEGIATLAGSAILTPLEDLSLLGNCITATGIRAFTKTLSSLRLRSLHLGGNRIGTQGVRSLIEATCLYDLERLYLRDCEVDDETVETWPVISRPSKLRWLDIGGSSWSNPSKNLNDAGLASIAKTPWMENLQVLHVGRNDIGSVGVEALAGSENFGHLHTLGLSYNPIGDRGAIALARSPYLGALRSLRIRNCNIGSLGAEQLAASSTIGRLDLLDLKENPIPADGFEALRQRFGDAVRPKAKV